MENVTCHYYEPSDYTGATDNRESCPLDVSGYSEIWMQLPEHSIGLPRMKEVLAGRQNARLYLVETNNPQAPSLTERDLKDAYGSNRIGSIYVSWNEIGFDAPIGLRARCHHQRVSKASVVSPIRTGNFLCASVTEHGRMQEDGGRHRIGHTTQLVSQRVPDRNVDGLRSTDRNAIMRDRNALLRDCDYFGLHENPTVIVTAPDPERAYPTDAAEKKRNAKRAAKERGEEWVSVKQKKDIEEHYDDCGEDLSAIMLLLEDTTDGSDSDTDSTGGTWSDADVDLTQFALYGHSQHAGIQTQEQLQDLPTNVIVAGSVAQFFELLNNETEYAYPSLVDRKTAKPNRGNVDILELCGGEGLPGRIAVRRKLKSGGNFDIVTDCDLNDPHTQHQITTYIMQCKPLVVVLSPVCTPFGAPARFNKVVNYDAWLRSYRQAAHMEGSVGKWRCCSYKQDAISFWNNHRAPHYWKSHRGQKFVHTPLRRRLQSTSVQRARKELTGYSQRSRQTYMFHMMPLLNPFGI